MTITGNRRLIAFKTALWFLVGSALSVGVARLVLGLGATSNLSDGIPWGLWKAFNVLACVPMAAGGFVIAGIVHCCHLRRYHGIVRATVLIAFLGYMTAVTGLVIDIGKPWNIWRPLFYWNAHSPLFEVAWCIILYSLVMIAEFAPVVGERLGWTGFTRLFARLTPVLAVLAVAISTLHQSTLGTLFTLSANRLHPLWYSPLLNVLFLVSAVGLGLGFLCLQILLTSWLYKRQPPWEILAGLARAASWVLAGYVVIRLADLAVRGQLGLAFANTTAAWVFWLEILLCGALPFGLLAVTARRRSWAIVWGSGLAVIGMVLHRANVGTFSQISEVGFGYWPSLMEIAVTLGVVALLGLIFLFFAEHVKLWEKLPEHDGHLAAPVRDPMTGLYFGAPWLGDFRRALAAAAAGVFVGLVILEVSVPRHTAPQRWPVPAPRAVNLVRTDVAAGPDGLHLELPASTPRERLPLPVAAIEPAGAGSAAPGLLISSGHAGRFVLFDHAAHERRLGGATSCATCHHRTLPLATGTRCSDCHRDMYRTTDTFDHARHETALDGRASCARCHAPGRPRTRAAATACDACHPPAPGARVAARESGDGAGFAPGYERAVHGLCVPCHRQQEATNGWAAGTLSECAVCHRQAYYLEGPVPPRLPRGPREGSGVRTAASAATTTQTELAGTRTLP